MLHTEKYIFGKQNEFQFRRIKRPEKKISSWDSSSPGDELIFTPEVAANVALIFAAMPNCMAKSVSTNTHPDTQLYNIEGSIYSGQWVASEWLGHYHPVLPDQPNPRLRKSATQVKRGDHLNRELILHPVLSGFPLPHTQLQHNT